MLAYRHAVVGADTRQLTQDLIPAVCDEVIAPSNFFTSMRLGWSRVQEEPFWELFLGQALGRSQTRERRQFESWWVAVDGGDTEEPLLAVRWDRDADVVYVTRAIECRIREGYESQPGVFDTRTVVRWVRELVGTIPLSFCRTVGRLRDELQGLVLHAVIGTSRLPLTSLESPLPAFALGQLAFAFRAHSAVTKPDSSIPSLSNPDLSSFEKSKLLESVLRSDADVAGIASRLSQLNPDREHWLTILLSAFNGASLSPYTDFVPRALSLVRHFTESDAARRADFLSRLVLLIDRHLCAYDLVKFHHRGANYPDALLLDELWNEMMELVETQPDLLTFRAHDASQMTRRRALRHALLLRLEYAGHLVPNWPTSIGENARIMPVPFGELPEEQIHAPQRRTRKLFDGDVPDSELLWSTLNDLTDRRELRELGTALFLNRPLGIAKLPGEPDRTPLVSHRLFSRSIAERRLSYASRRVHPGGINPPARWLDLIDGLPLTDCGSPPRLGVVSLHDAMLTSDDWIVSNTTRSSLREFERAFDWSGSGIVPSADWRLLLPDGEELIAYNSDLTPACRVVIDISEGYRLRGGVEVPAAGLIVSPHGSSNKLRIPAAMGE